MATSTSGVEITEEPCLSKEEITTYIKTLLDTHRRWNEVVCQNIIDYLNRIFVAMTLNGDTLPDINIVHAFMEEERKWVGFSVAFTTERVSTNEFREKYGDVLERAINRFSRRFKIVYLVEPMADVSFRFAHRGTYATDVRLFLEITREQVLQTIYHERRHLFQDQYPNLHPNTRVGQEDDASSWSIAHFNHMHPALYYLRGRKHV